MGGRPVVPAPSKKDKLVNSPDTIRRYNRDEAVVFRMTVGEFGGLSNMAPGFPVAINGISIPTVEALYQACRFPTHFEIQQIILDQPSPMTAKMKSKKYRELTRSDWDRTRVSIMRWCLRVKLAHNWQRFGAVLLKTGDRPIVEESKHDDFWGAKPHEDRTLSGFNALGRLLMELRKQIRDESRDGLRVVEPLSIPDFRLLDRPIEKVVAGQEADRPVEQAQQEMYSH